MISTMGVRYWRPLRLDDDVDVGLEAHVAPLHDAFGDAEVPADVAQRAGKEDDLLGAVQVRLGDDLQQRCAGAVEVDDGIIDRCAARPFVQQLAGIFFEVGAADADGFGLFGAGFHGR